MPHTPSSASPLLTSSSAASSTRATTKPLGPAMSARIAAAFLRQPVNTNPFGLHVPSEMEEPSSERLKAREMLRARVAMLEPLPGVSRSTAAAVRDTIVSVDFEAEAAAGNGSPLKRRLSDERLGRVGSKEGVRRSTMMATGRTDALSTAQVMRLKEATYPALLDLSTSSFFLQSDDFLADIPDEYKEIDLSFNCLRTFANGGHLSHLKRLFLCSNMIGEYNFEGLSSLVQLVLSNNSIRVLNSSLSALRKLVYLDLSGNPLHPNFNEFSQLKSLRVLDMSFCGLESKSTDIGKLLLPLSKLKNLQYLCLFGNPLTQRSSRPKQLTIKTLSRLQFYDYEPITMEMRSLANAVSTEPPSQSSGAVETSSSSKMLSRCFSILDLVPTDVDMEVAPEELFRDGSNLLPCHVWLAILSPLSTRELANVMMVNTFFNRLAVRLCRERQARTLTKLTVAASRPLGERNDMNSFLSQGWLTGVAVELRSLRQLDTILLQRQQCVLILADELAPADLHTLYSQLCAELVSQYDHPSFRPSAPPPSAVFRDAGSQSSRKERPEAMEAAKKKEQEQVTKIPPFSLLSFAVLGKSTPLAKGIERRLRSLGSNCLLSLRVQEKQQCSGWQGWTEVLSRRIRGRFRCDDSECT